MALSIAQLLTFTVVAGFGTYFAGKLLGCRLSLPISFAIAATGAVAFLIPTIGAVVSFLLMVVGTWRFSDGELMESFMTAAVARLLVIPALIGLDSMIS